MIEQMLATARQHQQTGRLAEAESLYRQILRDYPAHPDAFEAWKQLGIALQQSARSGEAVVALGQSVSLRPNQPETLMWLGVALATQERLDDAIGAFTQTLALAPKSTETMFNLALAFYRKGLLDDSIAVYRFALSLRPAWSIAWNNCGNAYRAAGRLDEALACYDRAITSEPVYEPAHSNRLFTLNYHPGYDSRAILLEHRKWNEAHARSLIDPRPHPNLREENRRLRIGYVGADFRFHCQSFFTIPLLSHHNHEQFEIYCYASVEHPDEYTDRIRGYVDVWRDCVSLTDAQIADKVRADKIDILVDLTMHMSNGRPLLFARKPAPIQVAWLAYPGTTGLSAMDYRLTDPYLDPEKSDDANYAERSVRLPDTFWCYDPLTPSTGSTSSPRAGSGQASEPEVNPLPALSAGHVTFGSMNNFCKVSDSALDLWAKVLQAVPNSRLILMAPLGEPRRKVLEKLGIESDRVDLIPFQPREKYLQTYHRIDIGLDTVPYNGHTTSLDSFWMGVPVITLKGSTAMGRAGISLCGNLGLPELIASDSDQFVEIAVKLAGDLSVLSELRQQLRGRMEGSPLMDAARFARNMEAAYREMWRSFCR